MLNEGQGQVTHLFVRLEFNVLDLGGKEPMYDWC